MFALPRFLQLATATQDLQALKELNQSENTKVWPGMALKYAERSKEFQPTLNGLSTILDRDAVIAQQVEIITRQHQIIEDVAQHLANSIEQELQTKFLGQTLDIAS